MNRTLRVRRSDRQVFEDVRSGLKSLETRAATPKYQKLSVGDTVTFVCEDDRFTRSITRIYRFKSIDALPWKRVMPRAASLDEVKRVYASYPRYAEKIRAYGLIGFELS